MGRTRYGSGWTTAFWLGEIVEGLSGESPLIRAAPQKLLSLRRPLSVLIVPYQAGPSLPRTLTGLVQVPRYHGRLSTPHVSVGLGLLWRFCRQFGPTCLW